jgi:hypothetical protein
LKTKEKEKARALRQEGRTIPSIASELCVSKSSVSVWVKDVELSPEQIDNILDGRNNWDRFKSGAKWSSLAREDRQKHQDKGAVLVKNGQPSSLLIAGCMLYWAEGSKSRNVMSFSNTDPDLLQLFIRFLRDVMCVANEDITFYVRLNSSSMPSIEQVKKFWRDKLGLSEENFRKISIDVDKRIRTGKKTKVHPYGNVTITVCSTELVQTIYGAIQEFAGCDKSEWLT